MPIVRHSLSITTPPQIVQIDDGTVILVTIVLISRNADPVKDPVRNWHPSYYAGADLIVRLHPDFKVVTFKGNVDHCTLILATPTLGLSLEYLRQNINYILQDHEGVTLDDIQTNEAQTAQHQPGLWWASRFILMVHQVFPPQTHCGPDGHSRVFANPPTWPGRPNLVKVDLCAHHLFSKGANPVSREVLRQINFLAPPPHSQMRFEVRTFYVSL